MVTHITEQVPRSIWYGWADPARATTLRPGALTYLRATLALESIEKIHEPVDMSAIRLPTSTLDPAALAELWEICGSQYVSIADHERILHAGGKSTPDLLRIRSGDALGAPDAVIFPADAEAVRRVLEVCVAHRIAVVPFGGGTSVVGGVHTIRTGFSAAITLDLRRLDKLVDLDPVARTATLQAGMRGPDIEAALQARGFTLGHLPQSHQEATLGGYVATRSAGQASTGYGRSDALVKSVALQTPTGPMMLGSAAPGSAAGPKLLDLVVGSEGTLGVITSASMKITPVPEHKSYGAWSFPSFAAGAAALRQLEQDGVRGDMPHVCRLSDSDETAATFKLGGTKTEALGKYLALRGQKTPALALFVWEGPRAEVTKRKRRSARILKAAAGVRLGPMPATAWEHGRFSGPYLRDELLTRGVYVETLETSATWSALDSTYAAVRGAILDALGEHGKPGYVQTHISHVYPDGASLYFTFLGALEPDGLAQNERIKAAASKAIVGAGATITHHHAVGIDHSPYMEHEIGALGIEVLASVKHTLDPTGIMNPGKLIPTRKKDNS
ncbi:FAD-binding protein [Arthrobacter sp. MYb227]|uniref:FAD-binding oxidoreductase n=1 Tax=Arthrobacter sp. MYb227 TaxID=1848601 RepID=UPI000CFB66E5|nr:FAD-binding oxidoreductase [Arthrobacter sp. MYb227]PQZ92325.1 FAD-binding protein [Arthrobacter sp. MYb227]